jgi:hypothetical protein
MHRVVGSDAPLRLNAVVVHCAGSRFACLDDRVIEGGGDDRSVAVGLRSSHDSSSAEPLPGRPLSASEWVARLMWRSALLIRASIGFRPPSHSVIVISFCPYTVWRCAGARAVDAAADWEGQVRRH